jgi:prevent-host-death family protein
MQLTTKRQLRRSPTGDGKHLPPQHLRMQLGRKATSHHDIDRLGVASTADESVYRPVATSPPARAGQSLRSSLPRSSSDMYKSWFGECTVHGVEVSVTELRAHLSDWLDRARAGGEVVITDRGIPVARLAALDSAGTLERLTAEGVIGKATAQRPVAAGRSRPRPRRPVSDRVSDQRR